MVDFYSALRRGAETLGLNLDEKLEQRLLAHYRLLLRWNRKVNLTAIVDPKLAAERLYLDSLVLAERMVLAGGPVHDVGSGAGFPGLVIKARHPGRRVILTEARHRKVSFLRRAASEMGLLEGTQVTCARLGWSTTGFPPADDVVSRAAFPPGEWLRLGAELVSPEGRLWLCCGHPAGGEVEHGEVLPDRCGVLGLESDIEYTLPFTGVRRRLLSYRRRDQK